ncbi:DUF4942 domain-containing protein, partial [Escherichia coli]
VGEGKLMTHDEPCSMAPDDKHDLISGTCSHLPYEDEMFNIRYFKKGSAHITFRKPELVDRLNDIIARHYSEMLPSL